MATCSGLFDLFVPSALQLDEERAARARTRESDRDRETGWLFGRPLPDLPVRTPAIADQVLASTSMAAARRLVREFGLAGFGRPRGDGEPLTVVNADTQSQVTVGRQGILKSTSNSARGRNQLAAVTAAPELIERARLVSDEPDREGNPDLRYLNFTARVEVAGETLPVRLVIKATQRGRAFYDLQLVDLETNEPAGNSGGRAVLSDRPAAGPSTESIDQDQANVNPDAPDSPPNFARPIKFRRLPPPVHPQNTSLVNFRRFRADLVFGDRPTSVEIQVRTQANQLGTGEVAEVHVVHNQRVRKDEAPPGQRFTGGDPAPRSPTSGASDQNMSSTPEDFNPDAPDSPPNFARPIQFRRLPPPVASDVRPQQASPREGFGVDQASPGEASGVDNNHGAPGVNVAPLSPRAIEAADALVAHVASQVAKAGDPRLQARGAGVVDRAAAAVVGGAARRLQRLFDAGLAATLGDTTLSEAKTVLNQQVMERLLPVQVTVPEAASLLREQRTADAFGRRVGGELLRLFSRGGESRVLGLSIDPAVATPANGQVVFRALNGEAPLDSVPAAGGLRRATAKAINLIDALRRQMRDTSTNLSPASPAAAACRGVRGLRP